jgi:hypothetical protein
MANNFRGNDALGKMNFLGNVIRDIAIRGTVIRANDFRGTDPYPMGIHTVLSKQRVKGQTRSEPQTIKKLVT